MGGWGCTTGRSGPDCTVGPRSGPDCTVGPRSGPIAPSGPDQGEIALSSFALQGGILSNTGGKDGPGAFREDSGRVWCCWGYRPSLFLLDFRYTSILGILNYILGSFGELLGTALQT